MAQATGMGVMGRSPLSSGLLGGKYKRAATGYRSWTVSPGLGIGEKPATYAPPVLNGTK